MIFILRGQAPPPPPGVRVVASRQADLFCVGDPEVCDRSRVVRLHDGWYADELGGGVAVWGHGRFWEVRSTPFEVKLSDRDVS